MLECQWCNPKRFAPDQINEIFMAYPRGMKKIIRVWDLPVRVFHWLLVLCIIGSIISVNIGGNAIEWHAYFGYSVLTLLIFRITWGFVGSTHARFTSFFPNREKILNYLLCRGYLKKSDLA